MKQSTVRVDLAKAWTPYDVQAEFIASDALFSLFLAGVGAGKSYALVRWLIRRVLANGRATGALLGRTMVDVGSVLLPDLFDAVDQVHQQCGLQLIVNYDKANHKLTWCNGGMTYIRPYNRIAKIRGLTLTYACADEVEWAEADPDEIWAVLSGRLRGKGPMPGIAFATSPNGLRGITKRFYDAQLAGDDAIARGDAQALAVASRFKVVTASSFANPFLPDHFFDAMRSMSRRRYEQEALARVLRPLSIVYELSELHLVDWDWREHRNLPWVCGIDWGSQNHHVALMLQAEPSGRWICAAQLVCDDMPQGRFLQELYRWIDQRGPPRLFGVDRAVPECNQLLARRYMDVPVRWLESRNAQKVESGINAVRDMLDPVDGNPRMLFSRALPVLVVGDTAGILPALRGYRYMVGADGVPTTVPHKDNIHDHACDALRYAVFGSSGHPELHGGRVWIMDNDERVRPEPEGPGHSRRQT